MSRIEDLRAQLELAEVEQELIDAKAAANTPEVQKAREKFRKARDEYREARAAAPDLTEIKEKVRAAREAARSARPTPAPVPAEEETE
jgi:predicted  nucleic acid-binding Zn-ribbon protein